MCSGTHNELSNQLLMELMQAKQIAPDDNRIHFAQLFGMSDQISYTLSKAGYNAVKYVPYGPVERDAVPVRRASETLPSLGKVAENSI
ncbi:MAG: hypothetical protein HC817_16360 [Saprospiraceae bacterium]|nr:hypothetical protein [Saprospiraceae bacterium]